VLAWVRDLLSGAQGVTGVPWPQPDEGWDENEPPVKEIDHTGDDPGPERLSTVMSTPTAPSARASDA
jgi:hypothetical protein